MKLWIALFAILALCTMPSIVAASETQLEDPGQEKLDLTCDVCILVVGWVEGQLKNGTTKHRIAEQIGFLCKIFPWPIGSTCLWAVEQFVSIVVNLIVALLPPKRICYIMNMCATLANMFPTIDITNIPCAKCAYYTAHFMSVIPEDATAQQVAAIGTSSCATFTSPAAHQECLAYISRPGVPALLAAKAPMEKICVSSGSCHALAA